ncbi:hypothetical protein SCARR_04185 [Pontiella sulfatireligans]|uniref:Uncharacterized protein n=1 Tax=Pontiella sulfatireligans TaxID=2750658 RepID=A0A6C2US69_9BACT|nr:hypothetical protein SCARR_04185 [Pontiella sulfatireligans]
MMSEQIKVTLNEDELLEKSLHSMDGLPMP